MTGPQLSLPESLLAEVAAHPERFRPACREGQAVMLLDFDGSDIGGPSIEVMRRGESGSSTYRLVRSRVTRTGWEPVE